MGHPVNNVVKILINHTLFDELYHRCMVIRGILYYWFIHVTHVKLPEDMQKDTLWTGRGQAGASATGCVVRTLHPRGNKAPANVSCTMNTAGDILT